MEQHNASNEAKTAKSIRYNVPQNGNPFGDTENFTLHTNGVTIYFDRIRAERSGYIFIKHDSEIAYIATSECDVNPEKAKEYAENKPGEKIRFSDPV